MFWRDDIDPANEPAKTLLKRGEFVDESRDGRIVPYKLYYPADYEGGRLPVIFWSHGFGGNRDGAAFLSRFLTAHGYILMHITHHGTDSSLWEGKEGHPWDVLRKAKIPRETTLARFADVPFALDQLRAWAEDNPEVGQHMDFERLGMSGHSFGAMTTQAIAGQMVPDEQQKLVSVKDERFRAGILYSPVPIAHLTEEPHEKLYGSIDIPLLHMTGTADNSPLEGFDYDHRLLVHEYTAHPEKYLLIKEGGDHMVYNGTRGKLAANPKRERHEDIVKVGSLAFWDAQLKDDEKAREWVAGGGLQGYIAEDGKFKASS